MATIAVTIAGAPKSIKAGTLHITMTANGRATASFKVDSTDGTYRPAQDAEVVITENGTTIFGGLLEEPKESGLANGKGIPAITTSVSAADYNVYAERRYVNETFPSQTMKARLAAIVSGYFSDYGVTLSGSQVDGPTLPAADYTYVRADEVLNETMTLTAEFGEPFAWNITPSKVLSAFQPSTTAAPFNLSGDQIASVVGDIVVDTTYKHYANRVIVKVPSKQIVRHPVTFTGDGSTTVFDMPEGYTIVKPYGYVENGANQYETLTSNEGTGATWEYNIAAGTLTNLVGAPTNGTAITFYTDVNYAGIGIAEDAGEIAAHGIKEIVKQVESVPSNTTAQAIADGMLARCLTPSKSVRYKTHTAGILPGQSQSIVVSRRNLNGTAVISDVVIRGIGENILERTVTAYIDGADTNVGRGFRDVYKRWAGDLTGGSMQTAPVVEAGVATPVMGGPAQPNRAIQYNRNNHFGGDEHFIYDEETESIACGGTFDDSFTAADFSHCLIVGPFCEVADPS